MKLGSVISMYGCYEHHNKASGEKVHNEGIDSERGDYIVKFRDVVDDARPIAGSWGYILQIIFQVMMINITLF